jgi:UDP-glucuronate 4-epimerase
MKHALVTGTAGFIGSHLAAGLLRQGWQVTGLDARHPASDPVASENLAELTPHPRFRLARADVAAADLVHVLEGVQVAFHLAGLPGARRSWGDQFPSYLTVNVLGTQRVMEACAAAEVPRLVFASSSSVYGPGNGTASRETDDPLPCPRTGCPS